MSEIEAESHFSQHMRLTRRKLLSTGAAISLVALGTPAAVVEFVSKSARAQDEGTEEPEFTPTNYTGVDTLTNQYTTNPFWVSNLDLLNQRPLCGKASDDPGVYALNKLGEPIYDVWEGGFLMSPTSDVGTVVRTGQQFGLAVQRQLDRYNWLGAAAHFVLGLDAYVAHFGAFDYQREGSPDSFRFVRQYIDVSNFNIGVLAQQAGFSETAILRIAGTFAALRSSNADFSWSDPRTWLSDPQNWLDQQNRVMIRYGYSLSAQGAFAQPRAVGSALPEKPL